MNLDEYITAHLERPFVWGENDCILFAVNWINLQTGHNYLAGFPHWSNARQALRLVQSIGGLEAEFDRRLPRIEASMARDGDLGLVGRVACLFSGSRVVAPAAAGLTFTDRTKSCAAWYF